MNEQTNEWTNKWMDEWINSWMNEWKKERKNAQVDWYKMESEWKIIFDFSWTNKFQCDMQWRSTHIFL